MASTSETGHAKNVANFEDLISFCTGYGTAYNPSKNSIKLTQLQTLFAAGKNSLQTVKSTKTTYDNATNAREIVFASFKKLCTRIVNSLEATDAAKQTVDDAKTINRKIQGKRAGKKITEAQPQPEITSPDIPETKKQISVSQQSFDSTIDSFAKLIVLLTAEPLYLPNETDLKITALNTMLNSFKTTNSAVIAASTAYINARIARDTILYKTDTGLVDIAYEVKKYVKSVYGAGAPEYKEVSNLKFTRIISK